MIIKQHIEIYRNLVAPYIHRLQTCLRVKPKGIGLITGCPRSGTSAVCNWLEAHHGVARFFESRILVSAHHFCSEIKRFDNLNGSKTFFHSAIRELVFNYYASQRLVFRRNVIEKEPLEPIAFPNRDYQLFLMHLEHLFPEMKIMFIVRNPLNTIWSMMNREWGYSLASQELRSFTLEECIQTWNACADLAIQYAHKNNVYVLKFENLIKDPVSISNEIIHFFNLNQLHSFQIRTTKKIAFNDKDKKNIIKETSARSKALDLLKT
jgi:hypothetical protein